MSAPLKVTVNRETALACLARMKAVLPSKHTLPIMACVLLHVGEGNVRMTATNGDAEITDGFDCPTDQTGAIAVPGDDLYDIIRSLPDGAEVTLEELPTRLLVSSGKSKLRLPHLPAADFPKFARHDPESGGEIESDALRRVLSKVIVCVSKDAQTNKQLLRCIYLHNTEGADGPILRAVATNGGQVAWSETPLPDGFKPGEVLIPLASANAMLTLLGGSVPVRVEWSGSRITLSAGDWSFASTVVGGKYFDYATAVPQGEPARLIVDRAALTASIRRTMIANGTKEPLVRMAGLPGRLVLACQDVHSDSVDEVEAEYGGEEFRSGFVGTALLNLIGQVEGEKVELRYSGEVLPLVIVDPTDDRSVFITAVHKTVHAIASDRDKQAA